eukprot:Seg2177.7 transcript_id=Seg2177.7/GoldUCD/mRNA.D3Y31 product="hypothetical protein" protein_id=Seg2177.7/GoldUCD/D3Y31
MLISQTSNIRTGPDLEYPDLDHPVRFLESGYKAGTIPEFSLCELQSNVKAGLKSEHPILALKISRVLLIFGRKFSTPDMKNLKSWLTSKYCTASTIKLNTTSPALKQTSLKKQLSLLNEGYRWKQTDRYQIPYLQNGNPES